MFARQNDSPRQDDNPYVDPDLCSRCHADVAATYRLTGMARTFHRVLDADKSGSIGDFQIHNTLYNRASDRYYTLSLQDGGLYESRYQNGYGGSQTNRMEMRIDYVVGSGNHARTFLHRTPEGKLMELPVSWYSESGGYWAMSPGYNMSQQSDFRREINYGCLSCHDGYPARDQTVAGNSEEDLFGNDLPNGIDCQRCHGPGGAHVKAASAHKDPAIVRSTIVNPATLPRDRQMDVCMQCHLETTSWPLPNAIRIADRAPFSYRPGEPLTGDHVYFDKQPGQANTFEVAHQAYQLRRSACFQNSQMTCLTCHDPHVERHGAEATRDYIAKCVSCHAGAHSAGLPGGATMSYNDAGPNCLTCHMWKQRTDDAVHVVMTNHDIQRVRPMDDPLRSRNEKAIVYRGEVVPYYPDDPAMVKNSELYADIAQTEDDANLKAGAERLEQAIQRDRPGNVEFYFAMGAADSKLGKYTDAVRWYQEALGRQPNYQPALRALAATYESEGDLADAAATGERAAALPHPETQILTALGRVYLTMGRTEDAQQVLRRALDIDSSLPDATLLLGMIASRSGDTDAAEQMFRSAIALDPDLAEAHNDLATLLARNQKLEEAEYHFRKAVAADPENAQIYANFGKLLAQRGSLDSAVKELQQAANLQPSSVPIRLALANTLQRHGDIDRALAEYRMALGMDVRNGEANLRVAQMLSGRGQWQEAVPYYRLAAQSTDPTIRQKALDALKQEDR